MKNPFEDIDDMDELAPETLKTAITSEIDTIRGAMEVVNLYVSNFLGAAGTVISTNINHSSDIDE